jgi:hypothetical protein
MQATDRFRRQLNPEPAEQLGSPDGQPAPVDGALNAVARNGLEARRPRDLEIPLTLGVVGAVLLPSLVALGTIAALAADYTVVVQKETEREAAATPSPASRRRRLSAAR